MKKYLKLFRVRHYIKNLLIFVPLFFGRQLFDMAKLRTAIAGFIGFCFISSAVYIMNDLRDIEKDKRHPEKRNRPIASGKISVKQAKVILAVCVLVSIAISLSIGSVEGTGFILVYFVLNAAYSMGLKNCPIIDVVILASGFVLRLFYGGYVTEIEISKWLYLVITTGSLYMGLGKRRNELRRHTDTRDVLKYYNADFLDKNMYVCVALTNVFYTLWSFEMSNEKMIWTVPFFIIILMCYSLDTEGDSEGDPVEVILHDKLLMVLVLLYALCLFTLIYIV